MKDFKDLSCKGCCHVRNSEEGKWPKVYCQLGNPIRATRCEEYYVEVDTAVYDKAERDAWKAGRVPPVDMEASILREIATAVPPKYSTRRLQGPPQPDSMFIDENLTTEYDFMTKLLDFDARLDGFTVANFNKMMAQMYKDPAPGHLMKLLQVNGMLT